MNASTRAYWLVFLALAALTAATVGAAFVDLGPFGVPVALGIASAKACLVAFFFMHLRESHALTRLFAVGAVYWFAILLVLTLADYMTRDWIATAGR